MSIVPRPASSSRESAPIVLTWTSGWGMYSPGRGIGYSVVIHVVVLTVVVQLLSASRSPDGFDRWDTSSDDEVQMVMYLPAIGGGGQSGKGGSESPGDDAPEEPSPGSEGLVYPGPQLIRSNSEDPTSTVQTLLQPELEDPPVLEEVVDLPNFISTPELGTVQRVEPKESPPDLPELVEKPDFVEPPVPEPAPTPPAPAEPAEPDPPELLELPILDRRAEVDLLKNREAEPEDLAVGLADTSEPEELLPVELEEGAPEVPVVSELAELPMGERDDDPDLLSRREEQPEPEPRELAELPMKERADDPDLLSRREPEPDPVEPEEEAPVELAELPILEERRDDADLLSRRQPPRTESNPEGELSAEALDQIAEIERLALADLPMLEKRHDLPNVILALTPLATQGYVPDKIPVAESRGRFTVSPDGDLDTRETEPGSPSASASGEPEIGAGDDTSGTDSFASVVSISFGSGGSGTDPDSTGGSGGEGSGAGSETGGSGSGSGSGTGSGTGIGTGTGSGSGAGSGPGSGPFAGITIVGGVGGGFGAEDETEASGITVDTGVDGTLAGITLVGGEGQTGQNVVSVDDISVQSVDASKYGRLSVVSTESSGGGLPYFGVFNEEQIRTVYLDMRQGEEDSSPLWTLEFAVPHNVSVQKDPDSKENAADGLKWPEEDEDGGDGQATYILPVPVVKEAPNLPDRLVRKYARRMIIVYAVVSVEGKMEEMSVMESPDDALHEPVLEALRRWVFKPGILNGVAVPVRLLLGMPLWVPLPPQ